MRIPSEIRNLRYSDFDGNVIRIHQDTKTGAREVPLFREIREIFDRLFAQVKARQDFSHVLVLGKLGGFRERIFAAIRASGVERWTKLFVNLRSSCITDMVEQRYSEKTLDAIFGNSAAVRTRHYIQFRKEKEYAKVLQDNERLLQKLRDGDAESGVSEVENHQLLLLRDLLVNRFGTGKKASCECF